MSTMPDCEFYNIQSMIQDAEGELQTQLILNSDHPIYAGHFPAQAVVPGVYQLQIAAEILDIHLKKTGRIISASNLKFLSVIDPHHSTVIAYKIKYESIGESQIKASGCAEEGNKIFFKFQFIYKYE